MNFTRHKSVYCFFFFNVSVLLAKFSDRYDGNQLWAFKIKGSAFLWHQVRCMVAVLLMIGQDLESPDVRNTFPTDLLVS